MYCSVISLLNVRFSFFESVSGLTGTEAGRFLLLQRPCLLSSLISLAQDKSESIANDACLAIVNISADEAGARALLLNHDSKGDGQVRFYPDIRESNFRFYTNITH